MLKKSKRVNQQKTKIVFNKKFSVYYAVFIEKIKVFNIPTRLFITVF